MPSEFTQKVIRIIQNIPRGKVIPYGVVAMLAGSPKAARQVVMILNSSTQKFQLPWYRVVGAGGKIAFKDLRPYNEQKSLLTAEGVVFDDSDRIADSFFWKIASIESI
jgi:methylated-DNA-protein-cysteine methyltransferase related protein